MTPLPSAAGHGLRPYPAYRDSGVEWLGQVPEHWEVRRNKSMLSRRKVLVGEDHREFDLLSLTKGGVIIRDLSTGQGKFSADPGTCQEVRVGDLIFCLFDVPETPRTIGLSGHHGMITGAYTVLECSDRVLRRFLEAFYIAMDDRKLLAPLYSGLRNTIPPSSLLRARSPVPPLSEQRAIVRYLNDADTKIRKYSRAKQRLIALLEEQKQALIHQAVTGQIDVRTGRPYPAYKDSGVEWLGRIPSQWDSMRLSNLAAVVNGYPFDSDFFTANKDSGIPLVRIRDLRSDDAEAYYVGPVVKEAIIDHGAILIGMDGDFNVSRWRGSMALLNQRMCWLRPRGACVAEFLFRAVVKPLRVLRELASGTTVAHLSSRQVARLELAVPPVEEQTAIGEKLRSASRMAVRAVRQCRRQIDLAEEFRTGLISDVVTGKLDVRGMASLAESEAGLEAMVEERQA